jgi:hypothetical protein
MKNLKDIILERRISNLEVDGKQVPQKYILVFNSYLEQIAESLADHDNQLRNEVCDEIRHRALLQDDYCPDCGFERVYGVRKCLLEKIKKGE